MAKQYVKNELSMADLEADIKRTFGIDMGGKMTELQVQVDKSREIYGEARTKLQALDGFGDLLAIEELRPNVQQQSDDFQSLGCRRVLGPKMPILWPELTPPLVCLTATLELKAEKQNTHAEKHCLSITDVKYSPDGTKIVSCGVDQTIKVWDAGAFRGPKCQSLA